MHAPDVVDVLVRSKGNDGVPFPMPTLLANVLVPATLSVPEDTMDGPCIVPEAAIAPEVMV